MLNLRLSPLPLVLALSAFTSSCWPRKAPKAFTPPPPQTQPQIPSSPSIVSSAPPEIAGDPASTIPLPPLTIPEIPAPAAPKPPQQKKGTPTPTQPRPTPTNPPNEPQPGPRLGPVYSADETRQYTRSIEDSLSRVRRALDTLSRKNLNPDQQAQVSLIANFQKQAEQARDAQDLLTAVSLAQRADTLAQDLLGRIP